MVSFQEYRHNQVVSIYNNYTSTHTVSIFTVFTMHLLHHAKTQAAKMRPSWFWTYNYREKVTLNKTNSRKTWHLFPLSEHCMFHTHWAWLVATTRNTIPIIWDWFNIKSVTVTGKLLGLAFKIQSPHSCFLLPSNTIRNIMEISCSNWIMALVSNHVCLTGYTYLSG